MVKKSRFVKCVILEESHLQNVECVSKRREEKGRSSGIVKTIFRALMVEIGEAWNETRAFKMWSTGFGTPKDGLLEELVDGFHFLMNIVIELNRHTLKRKLVSNFSIQYIMKKNILNVNMLFEWYMQDILTAKRAWCQYRDLSVTLTHLHKAFGIFFRLCYLYGYKFEDVVRAYKEKNKENFVRQASGY
ncbi:conserved hypothetical protein (plasmid) [Bacillus cereus E33L]|uniref:dUTPase n=1 Tax=Bacillus cereus (strain ZK / E33L) TaxID=288681 RepID=Q4V112_BACCZ|nr:conserved hypothetical protein [Bacillus cereus E33L]